MEEIRLLLLLLVDPVTSQLFYYYPKNKSPFCMVSTKCLIFLKFPVTGLQEHFVFVVH